MHRIMINKEINNMYRQSKRWTAIATVVVCALLGSVSLWAQEDEKIDDLLNLTAQQKVKMEELRTEFKSELVPMKAQLREYQAERKRLESQDASEEKVEGVLRKIADQEIKITLLLNKFKKDYLAILTADQRKKLKELKSK